MIVVAPGPRAVEHALLGHLDDLLSTLAGDAQLQTPVRIIVPSQSLRLHVCARLVCHRGRSVAGVLVQTLFGAAIEVLQRAGDALPVNDSLYGVVVQQLAAGEPVLHQALGDLTDGYAAVSATVSDLLDAGFVAAHADPLLELLSAATGDSDSLARTRAAVRVAARALAALDRWGIARASTLLQRARDVFAGDPTRLLPARALLVHGFADATGVAADFIEELTRSHDATVYIDHPRDPVDASRVDPGVVFTERLRARFASTSSSALSSPTDPTPVIALVRAPGMQAEVRAVANRLRSLLDGGARAEDIAVVGRDPAPYATALRLHLTRLGIPFSGLAACAPIDGAGRRVGAVLDLLKNGERAPVERWLDATARVGDGEIGTMQRADLRLALRAHGAARIGDAADLDAAASLHGRSALPLPVRRGLETGDGPEGDPVARRRKLDASLWRAVITAAQRFLVKWRGWPQEATLGEHLQYAAGLLVGELGWQRDVEPVASLWRLRDSLPQAFPLSRDEFLALLERIGAEIGFAPIGGAGAGVQVLSVIEARARTWQHLFVLGMNRDVFPRVVRDDPLLPDRLRLALTTVLPDLPIKEIGHDEERYLFAQLIAASPNVTLSWQFIDDDGKPRVPSSLVERLLAARGKVPVETAPSLYAAEPGPGGLGHGAGESREAPADQLAFSFAPAPGLQPPVPASLRPAHEHAVLAGLYASRGVFAQILPLAIAETANDDIDVDALAKARLAVLDELDPQSPSGQRARLGPYFGFIGKVRAAADLRRNRLYVTTIERVARCPWQTFLLRLLGLEQIPDPLASLPAVSALMVGSTVHKVLEDITRGILGPCEKDLASVALRSAAPVPWPDGATIETLLRGAAVHVLREEGIGLPGFAHVLVERARPYLDAAQAFEWATHAGSVLAAEVEGRVRITADTDVWFRADRVDRVTDGLRLTDYKTGKPFSAAKRDATRRQNLVDKVRAAEALQAAAYALAAREHGTGGGGRYSFLKPEIEDYAREAVVAADDEQIAATFVTTVATVLNAWHVGSFFPRLIDADKDNEPMTCDYCEVSTACLRGDSGARRRLREWGDSVQADTLGAPESGLLAVWRLGAKEAEKPDEG